MLVVSTAWYRPTCSINYKIYTRCQNATSDSVSVPLFCVFSMIQYLNCSPTFKNSMILRLKHFYQSTNQILKFKIVILVLIRVIIEPPLFPLRRYCPIRNYTIIQLPAKFTHFTELYSSPSRPLSSQSIHFLVPSPNQ